MPRPMGAIDRDASTNGSHRQGCLDQWEPSTGMPRPMGAISRDASTNGSHQQGCLDQWEPSAGMPRPMGAISRMLAPIGRGHRQNSREPLGSFLLSAQD
ncbi:hypothetical protein EYF80_062244 [Liparis tanakae]|uniref:Uncharacterized protein n=1 Tax=Liparis tanakae TaxID=230148 RepID=A0A4Z2EGF6_9TELE|nr:hypothetical protein EYF80_062244 [Liparis tanakae]